MNVKRIDYKTHTVSIGIINNFSKPSIRNEYVENPLLNIFHPVKGNPVIEDLMDRVILRRSIPLDDGIATLHAIKEKAVYLTDYINVCIDELKSYKSMI